MITLRIGPVPTGTRLAGMIAAVGLLATACSSSAHPALSPARLPAGGGRSCRHAAERSARISPTTPGAACTSSSPTPPASRRIPGVRRLLATTDHHRCPAAAGGVQAGMLATGSRSNGSTRVTYAGHPLYRFTDDSKPGDTNGRGFNNVGAKWWLMAPSGQPITSTSSASAPAPYKY